MSVQERPTSPLLLKPEVKPKPEIPPKPSPPPADGTCSSGFSGGKVKKIVDKFTKQESCESSEQTANGTAELTQSKQPKRAPTIKPKPVRASLQLQTGTEQAPPLPMKRSRILKKQRESLGGEEGDGISMEGCRSGTVGFSFRFSSVSVVFFSANMISITVRKKLQNGQSLVNHLFFKLNGF